MSSCLVLSLDSCSRTGGVQRYSHDLGGALSGWGREHGTATGYRSPHDRPDDVSKVWGRQGRGWGRYPWTLRAPAFSLALVAECLAGRVRALLATHLHLAPVCHAAWRLTGVPYAVTLHGIECWTCRPRYQASLRAARRLLPVSEFTCEEVARNWGIPQENFFVLPNTVDDRRFQLGPRSPQLLQRLGLPDDARVVLTVARLDSRQRDKGHWPVLEALPEVQKAVPRLRYVLAGSGDDAEAVRRRAGELGIADLVVMPGFVPDAELPDYYRLCDAFAMVSRREGFGIVYLEALASGRPVLGGSKDAAVSALRGGQLGALADPDNPRDVATKLIALLQGRYEHAFWSDPQQLRSRMLEHFGPAAFQARVGALMEEMNVGKVKK